MNARKTIGTVLSITRIAALVDWSRRLPADHFITHIDAAKRFGIGECSYRRLLRRTIYKGISDDERMERIIDANITTDELNRIESEFPNELAAVRLRSHNAKERNWRIQAKKSLHKAA